MCSSFVAASFAPRRNHCGGFPRFDGRSGPRTSAGVLTYLAGRSARRARESEPADDCDCQPYRLLAHRRNEQARRCRGAGRRDRGRRPARVAVRTRRDAHPTRRADALPESATARRQAPRLRPRAVPPARPDRPGRHGHGLPRRARRPQAPRGPEGAVARTRREPRRRGPLPARGPRGERPVPPEHHARAPCGQRRGRALPRHGTRRWRDARKLDRPQGAVHRGGGGADRRADRRRPAPRAREGLRPPRHQAGKPDGHPRRLDQDPRHGLDEVDVAGRRQLDRYLESRCDPRHHRLPLAGTGDFVQRGRARGYLQPRRDAIYALDGALAV